MLKMKALIVIAIVAAGLTGLTGCSNKSEGSAEFDHIDPNPALSARVIASDPKILAYWRDLGVIRIDAMTDQKTGMVKAQVTYGAPRELTMTYDFPGGYPVCEASVNPMFALQCSVAIAPFTVYFNGKPGGGTVYDDAGSAADQAYLSADIVAKQVTATLNKIQEAAIARANQDEAEQATKDSWRKLPEPAKAATTPTTSSMYVSESEWMSKYGSQAAKSTAPNVK